MKLTEISLAQPPRVKWSQDAKGEEYVNPAEVCGSFGWAQLHSWARNFNDTVCPKCGKHAIAFATAFHDVVNSQRQVAVKDPENLKRVAAMFGIAARGEMQVQQHSPRPTFVVEGKFTEALQPTILALSQHLRKSTKELDVSSIENGVGSPVLEKLTLKLPSNLEIKFRQVGEHVGVYGCEPIGASSDKDIKSCKLLAIAHPREEETLLLEEAAQAKVPVKGDLELDASFGKKLQEALRG